ncbi:MAG TPA: SAM-dependent methyltransferase [Acetobacteraceae bacterium]|nr:SAM-dependent methyltransferase [Acetobacteraceae bacterium]
MERLDAFMARANADYYASRDPFADFITAPEISQVFGEILGLWAAVTWQAMGAPDPVLLAEAGPGRGTLMADALRAAERVPAFRAALRLHLVETSPRLRAIQAERLPQPVFHDRVEDLPDGPLVLLANEFLDALPIRQLLRHAGGQSEHFVQHGALVAVPPAEGACVVQEICEPARALATHLGARLAAQGGAALFLDYGPAASAPGDSLQALRDGKPADPLADPGTADLTAHVDFQAVAEAARAGGGGVQGPLPQGIFLSRLGLFQRSGVLARTLPPAAGQAMIAAAQRLAEPDRMGRLFKAMAVCDPALPPLPGFTA